MSFYSNLPSANRSTCPNLPRYLLVSDPQHDTLHGTRLPICRLSPFSRLFFFSRSRSLTHPRFPIFLGSLLAPPPYTPRFSTRPWPLHQPVHAPVLRTIPSSPTAPYVPARTVPNVTQWNWLSQSRSQGSCL